MLRASEELAVMMSMMLWCEVDLMKDRSKIPDDQQSNTEKYNSAMPRSENGLPRKVHLNA
ncbi:hypothetical protein BBM61_03750 [Vibrio parahaemolyticus]|uniref:Uncharacterized protein n=1 Tax=Vibrio parahaemolyticus TaxID=670 RepID=A0AAX0ME68_VIBPH|nr:hypothetical protein D052_1855 [Vibrio parahaemolyticus 10290]ETX56058.1 hypothetical protein D020_1858 [Vibrio parahaemolyticus SBR10290]KEE09486.1 hypothetical protein [Vibrio parahaemolyticus]KIS85132.1 hypothetical protein H321_12095 [Vibrio parahaemolyticus 97-10290]KIS90477.1 hypothetical protein H338_12065 [Vibrio parahaemolyticus EN9701173]KIS93258.1 hypothetical protein H333_12070 [Vibrio parahaemolyticus 12315]KIS98457.1 hypothetical protein H324_12065 [Vibrio parahaemolyticus 84